MADPDLRELAQPGAEIAVRVTPKASRNRIAVEDGTIRVYVTVVPEGGKANAAVVKLLSSTMTRKERRRFQSRRQARLSPHSAG